MPLHPARMLTRFLLLFASVALLLTAAAVPVAAVGPTDPAATDQAAAPTEPTGAAPYRFSWASPTRGKPAVNGYHGGAVVTVRFSLGGNKGMNVLAQGWPRSQRYYCSTGGLVPNSQYYTRPFGGNGLSYSSATGLYTYSWETREEWSGTCRQFQLKLADGSSIKRADYRIATFRWVRPTLRWHVNHRTAGTTVPVTFSLGGNRGTGIFASGFPKSQRTDCNTGALVANTLEQTSPAGPAGLSYDSSTQVYTYRWATKSAWAGTCRQFQLRHPDGSTQLLAYRFAQPGPVVTTSPGSTAYTENASAVPVDPALDVTDADDTNLESATARVSSGFQAGDELVFGDQNGISGAYDSGTGVLTLTGTASVADYRTALRSVAFRSSHDHPGTTRTVAFTAHDGSASSSPASKSLSVTRVNDAPALDTTDTALAYTEGDSATPVDPGITLSDPDSATMAGATVQISGNHLAAEDELSFANANGITGSYDDATGTLTLSGTASRAHYQAALRAVKYHNSSDTPSTATRTVSFQADDGAAANDLSNVATRDISVGVANDAPVVTASSGSTHYTEGDPATTIDNGLTVTDPDDTDLERATVSLVAADFESGDELVFVDQNGITGAYDTTTGTGVLTLTGPASVSDFQTALRSVKFRHAGDDPSASRTVRFRVNDGDSDSNAATRTLAITGVNDAPVLDTTAAALSYAEGAGALAVDPGITLSDPDSTSISGATVQITGNHLAAEDELSFVNANGITGSYNDTTGTLTLTGTASVAHYQAALRSVKYANSSDAPSTATRTVSFQVDDGGAVDDLSNVATRDISVAPANDAPVVTASSGSTPYTEGGSPVMIDNALTVSDADDTDLDRATVRITSGFQTGDALTFVDTQTIQGSYDTGTGVLTLVGSDSVANYQAALRSVTFGTSSQAPVASKTLEFKVNDGDADSNTPTREIAVTAVNDAPVNSVPSGPIVAVQDTDTEVSGISVSDVDAGTDDLQLTLSAAHGTLSVDTAVTGGVTAAQVTGNGTKSVVLTAPQDALNATLAADDGLVYHGDAAYVGSDAITVATSDLGHTGTGGTLTDTDTIPVNAVPPNAPPVAQGQTGASAVTTDEDTAKTITLSATDLEGADMTFTVVTAPQQGTLDTLTPTASCDTLTPRTCTAQVIYTPGTNYNGADSFSFKANDGTADSQPATVDITVNAVNDAPVNTVPGVQTFDEDTSRTFSAANGNALSIADVDAGSADMTLTLTTTAGSLTLGGTTGLTSVTGDGTGSVSATGSRTELNAALDGLVFTPTSNLNGAKSIGFVSDDGGATGSGGSKSDSDTVNLTITAVNDAPNNTVPAAQQVNEDTDLVFSSGNGNAITVSDADTFTLQVTLTAANGTATLSTTSNLTVTGNGTGSVVAHGSIANLNAALEGLKYRGTAHFNSTRGAASLRVVTSDQGFTGSGGTLTDDDTIAIAVDAVADAPVATTQSFSVQTNMQRTITVALSGAGGPTDPDAGDAGYTPSFSLTSVSLPGSGCSGCTLSSIDLAAGTFAFDPPAGQIGSFTVNYTVTDSGSPGSGQTSAPGTLTMNVSGPVIWFVAPSSGNDTTGRGTLAAPFATLGKADTVDAANHIVFLYSGGSSSTGITLASGEWLIGQAANPGQTFDQFFAINPPTGTVARPSFNTGTSTSAGTITLAANTRVRGLTMSTGTASGLVGSGGLTGITVSESSVTTTTGTALSLNNAVGSYTLSSVSTNGAANGVLLEALGASNVTIASGTIVGATSRGVDINGGTGSFSYGGSISTSSIGRSVEVTGHTGGNVTFSGTINDSGQGINLGSGGGNTNATFAFTNTLTLSTGANPAFTAVGAGPAANSGGTLTITGPGNTISTTTNTGLSVQHTTIGSGGLTFKRISSNGAPSAIVLNNTGAIGGLTVAGDGTADSGGTILASTGPGVSLTDTRSVSLTRMRIQNGLGDGISGLRVTDFALANSTITGNGNTNLERGIDFTNLFGTASITSTTISNSAEDNLYVLNDQGTLNSLTITGGTFSNTATVDPQNDGILIIPEGTANMTVSITNSSFTNHRGDHVQVSGRGTQGATSSVTIANNTFTNTVPKTATSGPLGGGLTLGGGDLSHTTVVVTDNIIKGATVGALDIGLAKNGTLAPTLKATVLRNTIGDPATANSGSVEGMGIDIDVNGNGTLTALLEDNLVREYGNGDGIWVRVRDGAGRVNATLRGNTFSDPGQFGTNGIHVMSGAATGDAGTLCADVGGSGADRNDVTASEANTGSEMWFDQRFETTILLPGYTGGRTDVSAVQNYLFARNIASQVNYPGIDADVRTTAPFGGQYQNTPGGAACPQP